MKMTTEQLNALGFIETSPGNWRKGNEVVVSQYPEDRSVITIKPPKRIRQSTKPLLNRLEQEYCDLLQSIWPKRIILKQALTFRLGNGVRFTPDLFLWNDGVSVDAAFDVKGPQQMQDDAAVKIKIAAKEYQHIRWYLVWKKDGLWQEQQVLP